MFRRLARRFFDVPIGRKLFVGYVLVILIPSALLIAGYHFQIRDQLYSEHRLNTGRTLQQAHSGLTERLKMAEGYSSLFQNSRAVMDYLVGGFRTESEEIYAFLEDIQPLISYVNTVDPDVKDAALYTYHRPLVPLSRKIIFVDEPAERIADMPNSGAWYIDGDPTLGTLRFEKPIFSFKYRRKEAYLSLELRLLPMLSIFPATHPDAELFLRYDGTCYALDGEGIAPAEDPLLNGSADSYLYNELALTQLGATIVAITPKSDIIDPRDLYRTAAGFAGLFALLSGLYYLIITSVTGRLSRFTRHLDRVTLYSLQEYQAPPAQDEVGFLIRHHNEMIGRIRGLVEDLDLAELKEKEAAFHALQAQIKPHFLFNALETLRMMAEEENSIPLADMLYMLGNFIRYSMDAHPGGITLADEIRNVEQYLTLSKVRMSQRLNYAIEVEDAAKGAPCPSFILQPLVENCIHHAQRDPYTPLSIRVCAATSEDGTVHIRIIDDGAGICPERLALLQRLIAGEIEGDQLPRRGNSIGIGNISERLRSFYRGHARFEAQSEAGAGTTFHITIPQEDSP